MPRLKYPEAKHLIKERLANNPEACKIAISLLYHATGGNKWLNPCVVLGFIKQARAHVTNERALKAVGTPTLSTHEWGLSLDWEETR